MKPFVRFLALVFVGMALVLGLSVPTRGDIAIQTAQGAVTGTGVIAQFSLTGQSTCQVKITGSPSGLSATVATSADVLGASGWDTVPAGGILVGANPVTTASNNTYTIAATGLVAFRVNVTAYTSGTTNYYVACSAASSGGSSGGSTSNVNVVNTPGVTVLNTPGFVCISGCGGGGASAYSVCPVTTTSDTVCKASAGTLVGFFNNSSSAQSANVKCYNNASASSGTVLADVAALGATQVITLESPGKPFATGLTCKANAAITGTSIDVDYI